MLNALIYLHSFVFLISAVNKDCDQLVLTSSKVNHTPGKNHTNRNNTNAVTVTISFVHVVI